MSTIKVSSSKKNVSVHRAVIDEESIIRLCAEAVAKDAGINVDDPAVTIHAYITSTSGSSYASRKEAIVELTVNHDWAPNVAPEES